MKKIVPFFALSLLAAGCYHDKADKLYPAQAATCDTTAATFSAVVRPVLENNCAISGCHDAATAESGYVLDTYAGAQRAAANTQLLGTINHASGYQAMPQGLPKLSDCDIAKITSWVNAGALNN